MDDGKVWPELVAEILREQEWARCQRGEHRGTVLGPPAADGRRPRICLGCYAVVEWTDEKQD